MDIYGFFRKIPGGILLIPMLITAVINTVFPNAFIGAGGMTRALFQTGTQTIAALIMFATGAALDIRLMGTVLKRCGYLSIAKLVLSFGLGFAYLGIFGMDGIFGISGIAFVAVICSVNPGIYMGMIEEYGDQEDFGMFAVLNLLAMPAIPVMIIGTAGAYGFNIMEVITILIPFALGMLFGNLDKKLSRMFEAMTPLTLPFLGCCFGASLNLFSALQAGIAGIILTVIYLAVHAAIMLPIDRRINHCQGYASIAMCSVAGIAISVPQMLGGEVYAVYQEAAIAQIALCMILTNLLCPALTKCVVKKWGCKKEQQKTGSSVTESALNAS